MDDMFELNCSMTETIAAQVRQIIFYNGLPDPFFRVPLLVKNPLIERVSTVVGTAQIACLKK